MEMERRDLAKQRRIMGRREGLGARQPPKHIIVRKVQQSLKISDFKLIQPIEFRIDKPPDEDVHLAHPAMPGAKLNAAAADFAIVFVQGAGHFFCCTSVYTPAPQT